MSTAPRTGQTPSKATISKLKGATYTYGKDLSVRNPFVAPDGGAVADYYKGWRFLPTEATPEEKEILKKNSKVAYALIRLSELTGAGRESDATGSQSDHHKTVNDAYYNLVIAPQIKAQQEHEAREEEEQRQTIATLKMRVVELESAPAVTLTTDKSWSKYAILGIGIVVFLIILRRRA